MDEKSRIRAYALRKRDLIDPVSRKLKDASIRDRLFSTTEFISSKAILFYASFRSEVSTLTMLEESLAVRKKVFLPAVDKNLKGLRLYEIGGLSDVSPGFMGIPEPRVGKKMERYVNDADLVVMPGAAFDADGNRLGYGAGYYDKLLSRIKKRIPLVALAYEEQIMDLIPSQPHDIRVHMIVTDERVIPCRSLSTPAV